MSDKNFKVKNGLDANGAVTITQPDTSTVPLTISANTLATGSDLFQIKRPDGTVRFAIGNDGALTVNSNINFNGGNMTMYPANSGQTPLIVNSQTNQSVATLIVKAATGQTGNLTEWQNSAGTVLVKVDKDGVFTAPNIGLGTYGGIYAPGSYMTFNTGDMRMVTSAVSISNSALGPTAQLHIVNGTAANPGLIVKGAASQSANLQEWQDSAGIVLAKVDASGSITAVDLTLSGNLTVNGTTTNLNSTNLVIEDKNIILADVATPTDTTADGGGITLKGTTDKTIAWSNTSKSWESSDPFTITTPTASVVPLIIKGAASQSASLTEWKNSTGNVLAYISNGGSFGSAGLVRGSVGGIFGGINQLSSAGLTIYATAAENPAAIIRGANSQTANLTEWQNSAGTVLSKIDSSGSMQAPGISVQYGIYSTSAGKASINPNYDTGAMGVYSENAANKALVVRGYASQSANLQEWQNSSGTILAKIQSNGSLTVNNTTIGYTYGQIFVRGATDYGSSINVNTAYFGTSGIIIRGVASQTADLQQWQDSSGNVLASISAAGKLTSAVISSINGVSFGRGSTSSALRNIAIGDLAGESFGGNSDNVALGYSAGRYNYGANNILIGSQTGYIGGGAGGGGSNNVYIGHQAGYSGVGSSNIMIGYQAGYNTPGSNQLVISNSNTSTPLIGGDFSAKTLSFAGNTTITSQATGTQGLIVKGIASQTADLQQWHDSSGTILGMFNAYGTLTANNRIYAGWAAFGSGYGTSASASNVVLIAKGSVSQTADLQQWQNSSGTAIAKIDNLGVGSLVGVYTGSASFSGVSWNGISNPASVTTLPTLVIKGISSQTADLQQWQDSAGTIYAFINNFGQLSIGQNPTIYSNARISLNTVAASVVGMVIRGVASQSGDLQQWQNSSGSVLSQIQSDGRFNGPVVQVSSVADRVGTGPYISMGASSTTLLTRSASNIGLIVQGSASQTANLQEWQESNGGVRAYVDPNGVFNFNTYAFGAGYGYSHIIIGGRMIRNEQRSVQTKFGVTTGEWQFASTPTGSVFFITDNQVGVFARSTSLTSFVIRSVSSQTANLQEWQDSSGTVLSSISSSGVITTPAINVVGQSVSSNTTMISGYRYFVDTTAARTLTLPASPSVGAEVQIFDASNSAGTYNITIDSNNAKIEGVVEQYLIDVNGAAVTMTYTGSTFGWKVRS